MGAGNINGTGNDLANTITGNDGANTLDGGLDVQIDKLIGGLGDDTYIVRNANDIVTESANAGADTVEVRVTGYTMAANVENLTIGAGLSGITATGNALVNKMTGNELDNVLNGGNGDDVLDGGAGADTLAGGNGIDTVTYFHSGAGVIVNLQDNSGSGGFAEGDTFATVENLIGSQLDDILKGSTGDNSIFSGKGDDTIFGGTGNDRLYGEDGDDLFLSDAGADIISGGAGKDTVTYASSSAGVVVSLEGRTAIGGDANGDSLTSIENLTGSTFNDSLAGGKDANKLVGGLGDDIIVGGAGADTLSGGWGNDTYRFSRGDGQDEIIDSGERWLQATTNINETHTLTSSYSYVTYTTTSGPGKDHDPIWHANTVTVPVSINVTEYDVVIAPEDMHDKGYADTLELGIGISQADLIFEFRHGDLFIGIKGVGQSEAQISELDDVIRLVDWVNSSDRVEAIKFANGATIEISDLLEPGQAPTIDSVNGTANADALVGDEGMDLLSGGDGDDSMNGLGGDDRMEGGAGNDIYAFSRGSGWDSISDESKWLEVTESTQAYNNSYGPYTYTYTYRPLYENTTTTGTASVTFNDSGIRDISETIWKEGNGGNDALSFGADITLEDVAVVMQGSDLIVGLYARDPVTGLVIDTESIWGLEDRIRIENWADVNNRIETFQFSDGTTIDVATIVSGVTGGAANDSIDGTSEGNWLVGGAGDDQVLGYDGNDVVVGGTGDDVLDGGSGNDKLYGGQGADIFRLGRGSQTDYIDTYDTDGGADKLAILAGVDSDQLWFTQSGDDLIVSIIGTNDSATVSGWYASSDRTLDRIELADGTYATAGDVEQLRSAMASFSPPPIGQLTLDPTVKQTLNTTLAAAWH
jgi:Ca2+-binding RTX toxin-like protein